MKLALRILCTIALTPVVLVGFAVAFVAVGFVMGAQAAVKFAGWVYELRTDKAEVASQIVEPTDG